jgi:hypothetical protein
MFVPVVWFMALSCQFTVREFGCIMGEPCVCHSTCVSYPKPVDEFRLNLASVQYTSREAEVAFNFQEKRDSKEYKFLIALKDSYVTYSITQILSDPSAWPFAIRTGG